MVNFIQELTEGRVFKDGSTVRGKSAESIADLVFLMILTLEVIRHENKKLAKDYADQILKWQEFNSMKSSANDLYNLIAVLDNQDKYDVFIDTNRSIAIPKLQLFRYLRDLVRNTDSHNLDRQFLIALEDFLKVSNYKSYRRTVGDWTIASPTERQNVVTMLKRELNSKASQTDIYQIFKSLPI